MMNHAKVFKKTAPNGKLTVYVERRELCIKEDGIQALHGVLFVDANYVKDRKVFGQFVLTFRYGREDEEAVMGLRFCNEACLQAEQLWPRQNPDEPYKNLTPLQDTLVKRLGAGAVPFSFTVSSLAPPSVTLLPARSYAGAPIGTNYDLRVFVGENPEDKPHKRSSIRMGMKLYQCAPSTDRSQPYAAFSKQLLLADGQVEVEATLDKEVYERGESININVSITNHSSRNVRRIKILAVQYVDVAMFSNGKFKNVVAVIDTTEGCPVSSGSSLKRQFQLTPARGAIKNWIALEEFYDRESALASTVARVDPQEKNVFAIYVNYYVKVKLFTSAIGGEVSVKVPFKLMRLQPVDTDTPTNALPEPHPVVGEGDPPPEGPQPPPPPPVPPTPPPGGQDQEALQRAGSGALQEVGGGALQQTGGDAPQLAGGGASQDDVRERGRGDKRGGGRPAMVTRCLRLCRLCLGANQWGRDHYLPVHV
ncbi:arrestin homolog isoform X3 [Penaeus japonicus]|uniref:arrestin homolog isoform X3 n=1 Tax=Penaeus japonicus TaxID=27405 RepID=UPI001C717380|nr:arrestin homolog isoform X3 [Penaeus japonicus]